LDSNLEKLSRTREEDIIWDTYVNSDEDDSDANKEQDRTPVGDQRAPKRAHEQSSRYTASTFSQHTPLATSAHTSKVRNQIAHFSPEINPLPR